MPIVDTNVVASLSLKGPFTEQARALYAADPDWRSEALLMIELANVLASQCKLRDMALPDALDLLSRADPRTDAAPDRHGRSVLPPTRMFLRRESP